MNQKTMKKKVEQSLLCAVSVFIALTLLNLLHIRESNLELNIFAGVIVGFVEFLILSLSKK